MSWEQDLQTFIRERGVPSAPAITILQKAVSSAGTGEALVATPVYACKLWLMARKSSGANAGNVYIGLSAAHAKDSAMMLELRPGDYWEMPIPDGAKIDLNTIFLDAVTANDGVVGGYLPI
jgi:hypothetical protein